LLCTTPRKIYVYILVRFLFVGRLQVFCCTGASPSLVYSLKAESKFWHSIKENMPGIFFTRLESWATPGVPDVYGCKDGIMFFLELKTSTNVKKMKLSPFQKSWHFSHAKQGGRSFILHQTLSPRLICVFPSSIAVSIAELSPDKASKVWAVPADQAAWTEMADYILHSPLPKPPSGIT
jgi:hypothetical protein